MATRSVVDPTGVHWRVRRRWYPWRRAMPLRDTWNGSPGEPPSDSKSDDTADGATDSGLPRNVVVRVVLVALAGIVWLSWGVLKVLAYTVAAVLFVALSLLEFVLELAVLPIVMVLRLVGAARWPVDIARQGKHLATEYAAAPGEAAALQDELIARLEAGLPISGQERSLAT